VIFRFLVRHRRACTGAAVALTVAEIAGSQLYPTAAFATLAAVGATAVLGGITRVWALNRRPHTTLVAGAGTLASPRYGTEQIWALACLQLAGTAIAATLSGAMPIGLGVLGCVLALGLLTAAARALPRGWGVTLRGDGIAADKAGGELFVPWEALASGQPDPGDQRGVLTLAYGRPELVRTTGLMLSREDIHFEGVDAAFLAAAIRRYRHHPELRHTIGTAAEQERLHAELGRGGYGLRPLPPPPRPVTTGLRALLGAALLAGATTLQTGLDGSLHGWSAFVAVPGWLGLQQLARAWNGWRAGRREA
jgi:hypothetical protein